MLCSNVRRRVLTVKYLKAIARSLRTVLGIETSCDETAVAVVDESGAVRAHVCRSQLDVHLSNGGIIPSLARTLHKTCIDDCVRQSLHISQISPQNLTAIAVTLKPGLPLSLIIGKNYAQVLALKYKKPIIPIHHMEAHALMALLDNDSDEELNFPFLTLLISGGHCILAFVKDFNQFLLLGQSIDDAPGDVLDKTARKLKLRNLGSPYDKLSGGAALELRATSGDPFAYFHNKDNPFPIRKRTCDFSFSGFSAPVDALIKKLEHELNLDPDQVLPQSADIAASLQYRITNYLIKRLQRAFAYVENKYLVEGERIKLVISGGCACNDFITKSIKNFCKSQEVQVFIPQKKYCTDNGVMIAWNGVLKLINEHNFPHLVLRNEDDIRNIDILAKAPLGEDISFKVYTSDIECPKINVKQFINS